MPFPLNPFRGLPNGREVWAWGMYDLANQSFQLLINTLLFSLFVANVIAPTRQAGLAMWSQMGAAAMILVVLLSPIAGALADQRAWKREILLTTGIVCAALTTSLALLAPGQIALTWVLYLSAAVACGLGENFLGSFLPEISTARNVGRVSAIGWTMSYVGALLLLGVTAAYTLVFQRGEIEQMRPMFVFSGLWFAAGILPAFFLLRERAAPQSGRAASAIAAAFVRLAESARQSARYRQLVRFFLAFFVYSMGVLTMVYFLGLIGDRLGFQLPQLIVLALVIAVTAGAAAAVVARVQDRVGHKRTIAAFLLAWIAATLAMAGAELFHVPAAAYWVVAALIGVALGGVGTASRAMVGAFTPPQRAGEFFGLWGMVYKLGGIAGVLAFGLLASALGQPAALLIVAAWFTAGLLLLQRVDEREGVEAAAGMPSVG